MADHKQNRNSNKNSASLLVRLVKREAIGERTTARWWRKVHRWFSFQFRPIAKNREISCLNKEINAMENRLTLERRVEIGNHQRQMETATVRLKEIESKIKELINANVLRG